MPTRIFTDVTFASLDLHPTLLEGIEEAGFKFCTPIQAQALPRALSGHDVQGQAQTGTGKSAAFLLAGMQRILTEAPPEGRRKTDPRMLVVAPTRELAVQIYRDAALLGGHTGLRIGVVFGGTGYDTQREMLQAGLDVLIGTPGRLIDYFKQHLYTLRHARVAVVDEADRMFDLGFIQDLRYLMRRLPAPTQRLNMLFSATLSQRVNELAYEHMNAPEVIDVSPKQRTVANVTQSLYHVGSDEKVALLLGVLAQHPRKRTIIFFNTKREAERVDAYLESNGYKAGSLNGDVPQRKRMSLLQRFRDGDLPILLATDVASRGLHIPGITDVINYDLPQDAEDYVHRVGRTARVGASGNAVSFSCERYCYSLMEIEKYLGQTLPTTPVTTDLLIKPKPPARRARRHTAPGRPRRDARTGRGRNHHSGGARHGR